MVFCDKICDSFNNKKKVRKSFTTNFKLEVIKYAEEHGNRAAGRRFIVNEKNIRDWRKVEPLLKVMNKKEQEDMEPLIGLILKLN